MAPALSEDPAQELLEVGVEPAPRVAALLEVATGQGTLDAAPASPAVAPDRRDGAGRVVGTDARLLFGVLSSVFTGLGFGAVQDAVFRDLVLARIVEPASLLDTGRVLTDLGQTPVRYATMKRTLSRCSGRGYRDQTPGTSL